MTRDVMQRKIGRIAAGNAPRVLELCSGAGGMALGFRRAGFDLSAHVELSREAAETYARNLLAPLDGSDDPRARSVDMVSMKIADIRKTFGLESADHETFDVLVAGLPCQAFARVGRSKLSSVAGKTDAYKSDPRATLYRRFLEVVEETIPLIVVLENVPDILNFGGHNVPEEIAAELTSRGYVVSYSLLNAAFFGVPQFRERLFLVAYHSSLGIAPTMPSATHSAALPKGYLSSRQVAMKFVKEGSDYYIPIQSPDERLPPATTAREALSGLPSIEFHQSSLRPKRADPAAVIPYATEPLTAYDSLMRGWPGFGVLTGSDGHAIRLTPRDYETFRRMAPGDDYPEALKVARKVYRERLVKLSAAELKDPLLDLWERTVPPYDASKFPNKWWKISPDAPVRTLTAHMGKDTYSHIHFDSLQARMVSVREAARLQSFPDAYSFGSSINAAFRQIGNAVPPLLSAAVAANIEAELSQAADRLARETIAA